MAVEEPVRVELVEPHPSAGMSFDRLRTNGIGRPRSGTGLKLEFLHIGTDGKSGPG